ncbi:MAG: GGDEF domain-containing protein [Desulfococcaceae bacterium]
MTGGASEGGPAGSSVAVAMAVGTLPEPLATALNRRMARVHQAETPEAALDVLREQSVALLILGPDLPPASAEDLCRRFRALDRARFAYVLAVRAEPEGRSGSLLAAGVDDLIGEGCGFPAAERRLALAEHRLRVRAERSLEADSRRVCEAALRRQAFRDDLTGVLLRPPFLDRLTQEARVSRRYGRETTLLLVDFDGLSEINRAHGLAVGDGLLKTAVSDLRRRLRESDDWGRLTGDTFGVLLRETGPEGAAVAAGRICRFMAETEWETETGSTVRVPVSVGGAGFSGREDTAERMLIRAESRLAEIQRRGGNDFLLESSPVAASTPLAPSGG